MPDEIKAGDTVVLKSGGPIMTATSVGDHYGTMSVWCTWFDDKKNLTRGVFPIVAVELA